MALWMLVALADLAILAAAAGALVTISVVAALAVLAGGVVVARQLGAKRPAPVPARSVTRRRA
ncbi:hypothetical protein OWR29_22535 [Actinoplanes sp. Pm04-4]|uniref:Uncharacterized protein n=1 Tax=Paractinoplanes pyxinae TaxID=2997416 RepID=A0ABT4B4H3_9ACTN|nr:hypothetical protein [Actinoplanes pyxinae]MCY1140785.1 hypothetical protein [Actinoplanes pyxinae]